jgi:hypothetical protein
MIETLTQIQNAHFHYATQTSSLSYHYCPILIGGRPLSAGSRGFGCDNMRRGCIEVRLVSLSLLCTPYYVGKFSFAPPSPFSTPPDCGLTGGSQPDGCGCEPHKVVQGQRPNNAALISP